MGTGQSAGPGLVADVGGTNLRMALATVDGPGPARLTAVEERAHGESFDLAQAAADFAKRQGVSVEWAAVAVAGPVRDGRVALTNVKAQITEAELSAALGGAPARLLNDFEALAMAAPVLGAADLQILGARRQGDTEATIVVLGPGTGFGAAALVRHDGTETVSVGEGGHVSFAPTDEVEVQVWRAITASHGRCSIERLLCGPGLAALHEILSGQEREPPAVIQAAREGEAAAVATVERFATMLAGAAGDFALAFGARGGVLIGGGIAPRLLPWLQAPAFRNAFEAKGRFEGYLQTIPTAVVTHPHATLLGAARAGGR